MASADLFQCIFDFMVTPPHPSVGDPNVLEPKDKRTGKVHSVIPDADIRDLVLAIPPEDKTFVYIIDLVRWLRKEYKRIRICQWCGSMVNAQGKPKLKICSDCKLVYYCSRSCQRRHWSEHKARCNNRKGPRLSSGPSKMLWHKGAKTLSACYSFPRPNCLFPVGDCQYLALLTNPALRSDVGVGISEARSLVYPGALRMFFRAPDLIAEIIPRCIVSRIQREHKKRPYVVVVKWEDQVTRR